MASFFLEVVDLDSAVSWDIVSLLSDNGTGEKQTVTNTLIICKNSTIAELYLITDGKLAQKSL